MSVAAMFAASAVSGCRRGDASLTPPQRPPAMVTAATAIAQDAPVYLDEIGRVVAVENVSVIPEVGGAVTAVHFEDGAFVKKGDLLFEIDPRPFAAAVASAEAALAQSRAECELAKVEFKRVEGLMDQRIATPLEFDQKRIGLDIAKAKIDSAEAALAMARLDLEHARVTSPITGRAGSRWVDPGNVVKANDRAMLVVQSLDPIYVEFTVTENDLGTVRKFVAASGGQWGDSPERGLTVWCDVPADSVRVLTALGQIPMPSSQPADQALTPPPAKSGPRAGRLTFLDNAVQRETGTVRLRALVDNPDHYFWPGQFVNARVVLTNKKNAVLIPDKARQTGQMGTYVYVIADGDIAQIRPIVAGQRQGDLVVVEQGLSAGERVVVKGQMLVQPGAKLMIQADGPPGMPGAAPTSAPTTASAQH